MEPPGSDQQEPVRWLQTCQGWHETLSLLGIREMGCAEGGQYMKMVFFVYFLMSPGVGMDSPRSRLCGEGCVSSKPWPDSFSGRDCSTTRAIRRPSLLTAVPQAFWVGSPRLVWGHSLGWNL